MQAVYRNFAKGGANLGYGKKRGRKLTIVLCEAQGVLHPTLAMLACLKSL